MKLFERPSRVTLSKDCNLCDKPAITGVVDFAEGGMSASFCPQHLARLCRLTLTKLRKPKKGGKK